MMKKQRKEKGLSEMGRKEAYARKTRPRNFKVRHLPHSALYAIIKKL
jgi:hypothetical protein